MINADVCWRPEAALLQTICIDSHPAAIGIWTALSSVYSLRLVWFHPLFPSFSFFGSSLATCIYLRGKNEAVSMVTCRATRGWRVIGAQLQVHASIRQQKGRGTTMSPC